MMKNKKGDSLIISYVLLIVIILGLSTLVYAFLKLYLPAKSSQCPQDVSIAIEKATCTTTSKILNVSVRNSGLFTIDAIYVRFANSSREVRPQVNPGGEILIRPLPPNNTVFTYNYSIASFAVSSGSYTVEVQPAVVEGKNILLCSNIASDFVTCAP
jgi:hypothetical protein